MSAKTKKAIRISLITVLIIVVILFATNPNDSAFKNYLNGKGEWTKNVESVRITYGRTSYWGIFSVFQYRTSGYEYYPTTITYLGIFNNFFRIEKDVINNSFSARSDTTTVLNQIDTSYQNIHPPKGYTLTCWRS